MSCCSNAVERLHEEFLRYPMWVQIYGACYIQYGLQLALVVRLSPS